MRLRDELDSHLTMSEHIQRYVERKFEGLGTDQESKLEAALARIQLRLTNLQLSEANLKDRIFVYSSAKRTEMAERSIQESRRVILCKYHPCLSMFCLIAHSRIFFLPVSLTSSIYGMVSINALKAGKILILCV